jgi:adenylosuccinate lyase
MTAKDIVTELAVKSVREHYDLGDLLKSDERVNKHLSDAEIDGLLDPSQYAESAASIALQYAADTRAKLKG